MHTYWEGDQDQDKSQVGGFKSTEFFRLREIFVIALPPSLFLLDDSSVENLVEVDVGRSARTISETSLPPAIAH